MSQVFSMLQKSLRNHWEKIKIKLNRSNRRKTHIIPFVTGYPDILQKIGNFIRKYKKIAVQF